MPCESTAGEVSFEWSHHSISSTGSKVRTTLNASIIIIIIMMIIILIIIIIIILIIIIIIINFFFLFLYITANTFIDSHSENTMER